MCVYVAQRVSSPGGELYRGNVFASGFSATGGTADEKNNVEQVRLSAPEAGEWTMRVVGTNIPMGPQGLAWAVSGAVGPTVTVPPVSNDSLWIN